MTTTPTPTPTTTTSNGNPSRRVDELARRVLVAARWPDVRTTIPHPSSTTSGVFLGDGGCHGGNSPTPHLDELERSVGVAPRLPPPSPSGGDYDGDGDDGGGGMSGGHMTCGGGVGDDERGGSSRTRTPRGTSGDPGDGRGDDECGPSSLIDLAPFPPEFYASLGPLFAESFRPGSAAAGGGTGTTNAAIPPPRPARIIVRRTTPPVVVFTTRSYPRNRIRSCECTTPRGSRG